MNRTQKGITLIALIITIIVMLILVAVTINVALNGGLFQRAKDASTKTQRAAEREELQLAVLGTLNNRGNVELSGLTITGWTKTEKQDNDDKTYYEFTSKNDNKFYVYDITGEILDDEPTQSSNVWKGRGLTSSNVLFDKMYMSRTGDGGLILGSDGSWSVDDITDPNNVTPSNEVQDSIDSGLTAVGSNYILLSMSAGGYDLYIALEFEENGIINQYMTFNTVDFDLNSIKAGALDTDVLVYVENPTLGAIGKYVYYNYDGNHPNSIWYVVGRENNGQLSIISTEAMGNITLQACSPAVGGIAEWNDIPNKIDDALELITENTFCNNVRSNISFDSGAENYTVDSTEYSINTYGNAQYLYKSSDQIEAWPFIKSGIYLTGLSITDNDRCGVVTYKKDTGSAGITIYYEINGENSSTSSANFGISIVVTLKTGVTLDKSSGDGTYNNPYSGLTNSGS